MKNLGYSTKEAEAIERLPEIDLLPPISHNGKELDMTLFGTNSYRSNIQNMQKAYKVLPNISFRPSTTAESISAATYNFENFAKPKIFDPRWLQTGYIIKTQEGVFVNPPKDNLGKFITNEKILKSLLKSDRKINGIYLLDNDFGFAPYDSFTRGFQDCNLFSQGGLARALEYTPEREAKSLRKIASPEFYKGGVNVWGFEGVEEPALRVVGMDSNWYLDGCGLGVSGSNRNDSNNGYAFGVLK
jgi:hypothetical protein